MRLIHYATIINKIVGMPLDKPQSVFMLGPCLLDIMYLDGCDSGKHITTGKPKISPDFFFFGGGGVKFYNTIIYEQIETNKIVPDFCAKLISSPN